MRKLAAISDPILQLQPDGQRMAVTTFHFTNAPSEDIYINPSQFIDMAGFLLHAAEMCSNEDLLPQPELATPIIGPINLHGAGISLGIPGNDSEILLVLDAPGLRFGFHMSRARLDELLAEIDPILKTAAVPRSRQPN